MPSTRKRLERENWVRLFPIQNNITYIVDEDEDGIIHRCSQCSWELTEENYCVRCEIQYSGALPIRGNHEGGRSDIDSDIDEPESNLEGFVVSDDEVEYDSDQLSSAARHHYISGSIALDDSDIESVTGTHSTAAISTSQDTIEISDEENDTPFGSRASRKRRIQLISDDETDDDAVLFENDIEEDISDDDGSDKVDSDEGNNQRNIYDTESNEDEHEITRKPQRINTKGHRYSFDPYNISDMESNDEVEDEEFPEDPFPRPSSYRFIDNSAVEDSEEEDDEEIKRKPHKIDPITDSINRARHEMVSKNTHVHKAEDVDSDRSDSDDSEAPDYVFLSSPLKSNASSSTEKPALANTASTAPTQPQTREQASSSTTAAIDTSQASKGKRKKAKKNKNNKSKRGKKKHKTHE
ncbi:hypothetical protein [Parasitella parasitica]|uniref:Uncharacterized protein n=1 Tax=Parasitella parasitica TaxID=35722 RepID=A0A0B7MU11_9FUNG|nr:hypothetical protein [Parasitella parasitica]